jgi:hypothetical protein
VGAEQDAGVPPPEPEQVQLHGPEPETLEAVPEEQRLGPLGAVRVGIVFAEPHVPLLGGVEEVQDLLVSVHVPVEESQLKVACPLFALVEKIVGAVSVGVPSGRLPTQFALPTDHVLAGLAAHEVKE